MFEFLGLSTDSELLGAIEKGGWVVMVLILMSIVALTITFAKAMHLLRVRVGQQALIDEVMQGLRIGDMQQAQATLAQLRHPVAQPLRPVLDARLSSLDDIETVRDEVERLSLLEMDSLNTGLKTLALIATIAPLLGLLGTVLGMITAFQNLQQAGSKVDPSILSGGIWEALLTTAAGLLVAIPVTVLLNWVQGNVTKVARTMEDTLSAALTTLKANAIGYTDGVRHRRVS
jgi:biopolymer transport protein ExbB